MGQDKVGQDVYLKDLWPSVEEIGDALWAANDPETYQSLYKDFADQNPLWQEIPSSVGTVYDWDAQSTYIREPPYFDKFSMEAGTASDIKRARPLAIFGESVTTDHISPAGAIKPSSPAGLYLQQKGVPVEDFNSYGSRRGNHRIMMRGTFANVRIQNLMVPGVVGGVTVYQPANGADEHLRCVPDLPRPGRAAADLRRPGVRHRVVARLGREGNGAAGCQSGNRAVF